MVHMWRSEDNFVGSVLHTCLCMSSGDHSPVDKQPPKQVLSCIFYVSCYALIFFELKHSLHKFMGKLMRLGKETTHNKFLKLTGPTRPFPQR